MTDKPKRKTLELTMHADAKSVDVFLFEKMGDADVIFPPQLRPARVLVVTTQENPRDRLRGYAVRNCFWFAGGNGTWAQSLTDRMTSDGQIHVTPAWDGLRSMTGPDAVAHVLDLLHAALRQAPRPLKAEELRSVLEQTSGN